MKKLAITLLFSVAFLLSAYCQATAPQNTQWKNKKVAFLGDSMTQKWQKDSTRIVYWEYLSEMLGLEPFVYGISGHQWTGVYGQALKLQEEHGTNVDAIFIFAGKND